MKTLVHTYLRASLLIPCALISLAATGQSQKVVIDAGTMRPLAGVRIITDDNHSITTKANGGFFISGSFRLVTFSRQGYISRSLTKEELMDTVLLLPSSVELNEVVIIGKAPRVGFSMKAAMGQATLGSPKPSGMDFLSIFQRHKVSKKERKRRHDAIANY